MEIKLPNPLSASQIRAAGENWIDSNWLLTESEEAALRRLVEHLANEAETTVPDIMTLARKAVANEGVDRKIQAIKEVRFGGGSYPADHSDYNLAGRPVYGLKEAKDAVEAAILEHLDAEIRDKVAELESLRAKRRGAQGY